MSKALAIVILCGLSVVETFASETRLEPGPVLRGTINVVAAQDQSIVVLTDSMLTETWQDTQGTPTYRQRAEPGQKLFQIDDRTVCTFAGFASTNTPTVPDFLNNVSAIMGRYKDKLRNAGPLSVAQKLEMLEVVFSHYLKGIANIRDLMFSGQDYYFELFIAGYDPDGTPQVGSLRLAMVSEPVGVGVGSMFVPVTQERAVIPVTRRLSVYVHGISDVALEILHNPTSWNTDPAVAAYRNAVKLDKPLSIEQMKALAISLKQQTAGRYREVGGPNQIAVLRAGRIESFEQPNFPPIPLTGFRFQIFATITAGNTNGPSRPITMWGILAPGSFPLYFNNEFNRVRQELGNSYYSRNVFRECLLSYDGGTIEFEKSNQVIDSDLLIGSGVGRDSPQVKQLLKDFKWRKVEFMGNASNTAK